MSSGDFEQEKVPILLVRVSKEEDALSGIQRFCMPYNSLTLLAFHVQNSSRWAPPPSVSARSSCWALIKKSVSSCVGGGTDNERLRREDFLQGKAILFTFSTLVEEILQRKENSLPQHPALTHRIQPQLSQREHGGGRRGLSVRPRHGLAGGDL